jgi:hypothetical protein
VSARDWMGRANSSTTSIGVALDGGGDLGGDQRLDLGDDFGLLGALEVGLGDGAVFGVEGRVGFDGQLAHGAHGSSSEGMGTRKGASELIGLPVLGRVAHVGMAEEERDVFAVERALENAVFGSGVVERVGNLVHGELKGR